MVTLSFVPETVYNSLPATLLLRAKRFRRYHRPSTGTITASNANISNVTNVSTWRPGDRIQVEVGGQNYVEEGTFVIAVSGSGIQLNRAVKATAPGGMARLHDAIVFVFTGTLE